MHESRAVNFRHPTLNFQHRGDRRAAPGLRGLEVFMNRDPRYVLSQEAKQSLLDQLRALTADDPISSPTSLKARPISLNASIVYDETLVDGAEAVLDK
jgi:hypothetical protein